MRIEVGSDMINSKLNKSTTRAHFCHCVCAHTTLKASVAAFAPAAAEGDMSLCPYDVVLVAKETPYSELAGAVARAPRTGNLSHGRIQTRFRISG
jgi:hypothetical protein